MKPRLLLVLLSLLLPACGGSQPEPTSPPPPDVEPTAAPTIVPTSTPQPVVPEDQPATNPTPITIPTPAPSISPWPLTADLYYLNDAGQVWRQSQLGDDSAVATITRLDLVITDYSLAPGGEWIAYRNDGNITISSVNNQRGEIIAQNVGTPPDTTQGNTLLWSPDGRRLAYASQMGFQVYSASGGTDFNPIIFDAAELPIVDMAWSNDANWLLITRGDGTSAIYSVDPTLTLWAELSTLNGAVWLSDGRLAFAPTSGGLAVLDPVDLASRQFIVPEGRSVSLPITTPDDQIRFFIHPAGLEQPGFLHTANPGDLSFSALTPFGLVTQGWQWTPEGARLVRPSPDGVEEIELISPLDGAPATFTAAGVPSALQFGDPPLPRAETPDITSPLYFMASQAGIVQVWQLRGDGTPAQPVTNATQNVTDFAISPQGTQIAYLSDNVLYRQLLDGAEPEDLITPFEGQTLSDPAWSPDGTRIAYANNGIWLYDTVAAQNRRLFQDQTALITGSERTIQLYDNPRWSPDGQWLLLDVTFFEGSDLAITPVTEFGIPSTPFLLDQFGAQGEWVTANQVAIYGQGGDQSAPTVSVATTGETRTDAPTIAPLFDLPTLDVTLREDGRLALLRIASPSAASPTSVALYSALGDGADLQRETANFVLNSAILSPDGVFAAGLRNISQVEGSPRLGEIEVINLQTGERLVVDGIPRVLRIEWGPLPVEQSP